MPSALVTVAKAGAMGVCAICLISFGLVLLLPGAVMVGMSTDSDFDDEFFDSTNRTTLIIGIVFLVIASLMLVIGIILCVKMVRVASSDPHQPTQTTQPMIAQQPGQPAQTVYPQQTMYTTQPGVQTYQPSPHPIQQPYPGQPQAAPYPGQPQAAPYPAQAQPYPGQPQVQPYPAQAAGQQPYPPQPYAPAHNVQSPNVSYPQPSAPAAEGSNPPPYSDVCEKRPVD